MINTMGNDDYNLMLCGSDLRAISEETGNASSDLDAALQSETEIRDDINSLISQVEELSALVGRPTEYIEQLPDIDISFNTEIDKSIEEITGKTRLFPPLSTTEYIISALAGTISVLIDVLLVGTPEVVKIYHGGEKYDGSKLTELIRKIKPDDGTETGHILKWLSDKCKVPYDISCEKGVVTPDNHRLRGLGHDPYLGLFFAIADILMGTTTCIDNNGGIRVLPNYNASMAEKLLSVFYYIGHIVSDLFTARGLPIPGFFLTQFFTNDGKNESLAKIAENMYKDGYDTRHLASMSVPVVVKNLVVEAYCRLTKPAIDGFLPLAEKELAEQAYTLKKVKMLFIANSIGVAGNIVKFVAPPNCCNPCALNAAQWFAFIRNSIQRAKAACRDRTVETVLEGRSRIQQEWERLLNT